MVSDLLLSDIHGTRKEKELADLRVSDRLLSDMFRTRETIKIICPTVSDLLLSDKRKHPLTALFGNEGMFWLCIY